MTASLWYVDVDFAVDNRLADDVEFDVLEALTQYSPAMSVFPDRVRGSVSLAVEAPSALKAAEIAQDAVRADSGLEGWNVTAIDVLSEEVREARNAVPRIPALVGYAEIADMAGVSRQRARELADRTDFPVAVVETAAGPLRVKAAVESWLAKWERKPGRPRKLATA